MSASRYRSTFTASAALICASLLPGGILNWDGGGVGNAFTTPENWVGDVPPVAGDTANIGSGPVSTGSTEKGVFDNLTVNFSGTSTLASNGIQADNMALTFSGSSTWDTNSKILALGRDLDNGDTATVNWNSTGTLTGGNFLLGRRDDGIFVQTAGVITIAELRFGNGNPIELPDRNGIGTYSLGGGTVTAELLLFGNNNAHQFVFPNDSTGTLTINNGGAAVDFAGLIGSGFFVKDAGDVWDIGTNSLSLVSSVPEPGSLGIFGVLIGTLVLRRRR